MTTALVTGLTGTFGRALLERDLDWTIRAYSRDEHKQHELAALYPDVRWLLGDVRDKERLERAMEGVDVVIHAAALKHVPAGEANPDEFVKTNVLGSLNVVEACHAAGVEKAVLLSSDKAVHPVNLYGASKLCAERLFLAANVLPPTRFSVVRYGNVKGSRGSVLTLESPRITHPDATRFWMEPSEAVDLVLLALAEMQGGEVFVPKIFPGRVADLIDDSGPASGLRPGEKLHETLIAPEEVSRTYDCDDHYRISNYHPFTEVESDMFQPGIPVPADFTYTSG